MHEKCVTKRHFSLNALYHASQVAGHSTLCICWCLIRLLLWLKALLHTLQV